MKKEKNLSTTVTFTKDLNEILESYCDMVGLSKAAVVRLALTRYFKAENFEKEVKQENE